MIVYSNKIILFVNEIKNAIKRILSREIGLKVFSDRFYDEKQNASYPIQVVIFNNKSMLGYFDPTFLELGFHECLIGSNKDRLENIIRHELAHYLTYICFGDDILPHGNEFREFCSRYGWGKDVYKATSCIEGGEIISDKEENRVLRKIQKLMALTSSDNKNEAEVAMIKSRLLLLKHNIDLKDAKSDDDERIFLKRIMKQKREDAKMRSIGKILETFCVNIVYRRTADFTHLEIMGNAVNIEIADYVATVLDREFDKLWNHARISGNLRGVIARNSFFIGIARGYCNKVEMLKREHSKDFASELMIIEKTLLEAKAMVYSRLRSKKSNTRHCPESSQMGVCAGNKLNINASIQNPTRTSKYLSFIQTNF